MTEESLQIPPKEGVEYPKNNTGDSSESAPNKDSRNNVFIGGGVILVFVLVVGSLFFGSIEDGVKDVNVRLGWLHQGQFAAFYVAQEKGYYAKEKLNVSLMELDPNLDQVVEVSTGKVDFSIMEAHQMLSGVNDGYDNLVAVGVIYHTNPHALAAKKDSGINSPSDFKGKTLGFAGGIGEGDSLFSILVSSLVDPEDITFVDLGFNTVEDFQEDRADVIDVYRIDQPYIAKKAGIDLIIISFDAYGFNTYGDVIVTTREIIEKNPEMVKSFVKATIDGLNYVVTNPLGAVDTTLLFAKGDYDDEEYQKHIIFESIPLIRGDEDSVGEMSFVPWSTLYESMVSVGVADGTLDVKSFFTNEFIK